MEKLNFLTSVRFWKLVVIALAGVLATQGYIDQEIAGAIAVILGGSVVVNTVDRFSK